MERNPIKWAEQELMMFKPIVIRAYQRSLHISEALVLRGFSPNATRTQYRPLSMEAIDWVLLCMMTMSLIGLVFARTMLWLYQIDLYYHPDLRGIYELDERLDVTLFTCISNYFINRIASRRRVPYLLQRLQDKWWRQTRCKIAEMATRITVEGSITTGSVSR